MRWNQGRDAIERLLAGRELERVHASRDHADHLLTQAHMHLQSADGICDADPGGAYALTYDAARKTLTGSKRHELTH